MYENKELTLSTYEKKDKELDNLENKLDHAEENLEFNFGIDD